MAAAVEAPAVVLAAAAAVMPVVVAEMPGAVRPAAPLLTLGQRTAHAQSTRALRLAVLARGILLEMHLSLLHVSCQFGRPRLTQAGRQCRQQGQGARGLGHARGLRVATEY